MADPVDIFQYIIALYKMEDKFVSPADIVEEEPISEILSTLFNLPP